jgi:two-component system LytT family response regulator
MHQTHILIADDEKHARDKIRHFLAWYNQDIFVIEEAENGKAIQAILNQKTFQLVIADINMPYINGLDALKTIDKEKRPLIIFTTAFEEYALDAFEVDAVDYLLKPFAFDRFQMALQRALERLSWQEQKDVSDSDVKQSEQDNPLDTKQNQEFKDTRETYLTHIRVEGTGRSKLVISLDNVYLIKSAGNYCEFFTTEKSYLRRGTLKNLMSRLSPQVFLRLNRSEVVKIQEIKNIEVLSHGDALVNLKTGLQLKWSRHYRAENGGLFEV